MQPLLELWQAFQAKPEFGIAAAMLTAVVTYIAKYIADVRLRRYEARLSFLTAQLRELYGPLYLLSTANDQSWREFCKRIRPGGGRLNEPPLTAAEVSEYVRWLELVFVPCNDKMRRVIEGNAHLFVTGRIPEIVRTLLAHMDELNVVIKKHKDGVDSNIFPTVLYPSEFSEYVRREYEGIVRAHSDLRMQRG